MRVIETLSAKLLQVTTFYWLTLRDARSRVSSGSIVSDYGLDDRAIGVRSPAVEKDFSSILCVQTDSGVHPASCTMGTGGPFLGSKARPGRDADHSSPSSAEVVNEYELYLLSPQAPPWRVEGLLYFFRDANRIIPATYISLRILFWVYVFESMDRNGSSPSRRKSQ
jgi:hypothetical protein